MRLEGGRPVRTGLGSRALLAILLLSLGGLMDIAGPAAAAPEVPTCIVILDTALETARVTSSGGETLEFSGSINVTTGSNNPRSLLILAEITPIEWGTQVSPTSENVSNHEQVRFNATVAVPPAALASTQGTLTIRASFLAIPGLEGSKVDCAGTSRVQVAQYYRVDIDTTEPRVSVTAGPNGIEASLIVHNLGNGRDVFTLDLEDKFYLDQVNLFTNLPRRITLDADQETNITFTVNATGAAKAGSYDVAVVMASDAQPQIARDNLAITVTVRETLVDQLIPDLTTGLILLAVVGGLGGGLVGRGRLKRKRAAGEARRQLQLVLRQRRETGGSGVEGSDAYGEEGAAADPYDAGGAYIADDAPVEAPATAAPDKVRVRVKAPPKA